MDERQINQDGNILIDTKLQSPKLTKLNVAREKIIARFKAASSESALFVAATGYGKTTIMRQLFDTLTADGQRTAWLSFDILDDRPQSFFGYFVQMLSEAGVIDRRELFQQTSFSEEEEFDVAFALISQAAARVSIPTALFFDDFHYIENPGLMRGFGRFLDSKSTSLRVYISSRIVPRLEFDRREMEGSFVVVDASQLRFSQIEAESFFEKSELRTLLPSDVSEILNSTEGWAAGLQIASISMNTSTKRISSIPSQFSGSKERVARYLYDNVMERVPENVRDFLLSTAPLSRFCVPMCEYVRGEKGNKSILQWLMETNLFLVSLDEDATWFRYHHLFAEFLLETAQDDPGFSKTDIHHRASEWCLEHGYLDEAVNYLLDIKEFDDSARIISDSAPRIARQNGDTHMLIRWIERLPAAHQQRYPAMMLDYAFSLAFTHATDPALKIVHDIRGAMKDADIEDLSVRETLAYADTVEALARAAKDDTETALEMISETRKRWPRCEAGVQGIIANVTAYCQMANNRAGAAIKEAMNARVLGMSAGLPYVWLWADCIEVMVHCRTGNLDAAQAPLKRALVDAGKEGENTLLGLMVHMLAANLAYLRGDIPLAQIELASGTGYSAAYGPLEPLIISHKVRSGAAAINGNHARALEILERGQTLGLRNGLPSLAFLTVCLQISHYSRGQDAETARRMAEQWGVYDGSWRVRFSKSNEIISVCQRRIMAEVAIVEGAFEEAAQTLDDLERRLKNRWPQEELITFSILKSHAYFQAGRQNDAARELSRTTRTAKKYGINVPFLEFASYVRPILKIVIDMRREVGTSEDLILESSEYQILRLVDPRDPDQVAAETNADDNWIAEDLTNREVELLRLIESGMTNAQLAAHLVLSVATVKWHLHNVFQKLGVKNRMGALAKARKCGLI